MANNGENAGGDAPPVPNIQQAPMAVQQPQLVPVVHAPIPIDIVEYPGPGTKGKQWLKIIRMYAIEYGWSPQKFLEMAQVRSAGELYHKLEGLVATPEATVDSIFNQILGFITPKTNMYQSLFACQRDGWRPGESMESLASRVRVLMQGYAEATKSTFTPAYYVDVFINMIRDKELSMRLREKTHASLDDAVKFASKWLEDKKNVDSVCTISTPSPTFQQFRQPEPEPMEVDQLRFKPRRFSNWRMTRTDRPTLGQTQTSAQGPICFACNKPGHTGNECIELRKCRDIIAKYERKIEEKTRRMELERRKEEIERKFRPTAQEARQYKLRKMSRLIQELDLNGDEEGDDEASDFSDLEEEDIMKNTETNENLETTVQDF